MIKALVLDDGYHNKEVVMLTSDGALMKMSLAPFINTNLCIPHKTEYRIKTAHYEDIANDRFAILFDKLNRMACPGVIYDEDLVWSFEKLYDSDEVVDGCDIY